MCVDYRIEGKTIETIGELADLLGGMQNIPVWHDFPVAKLERSFCLCSVDVKRVANALNMRAVSDGLHIHFGKESHSVPEKYIAEVWETS